MRKLDDYSGVIKTWAEHESSSAISLSQYLYDMFLPQSVIDVGCGGGQFLLPFIWKDCRVLGVDGEAVAGELIDDFKQADLRLVHDFGRFDLALCLEVIEHLQPEYEDILINTLVRSSDVIVFSGAKPGQVGTHHYNCREKSYWVDKFKERDYSVDPSTPLIINFLEKQPVFKSCPWLAENLFVVRK